jgi:hypothetical protein
LVSTVLTSINLAKALSRSPKDPADGKSRDTHAEYETNYTARRNHQMLMQIYERVIQARQAD